MAGKSFARSQKDKSSPKLNGKGQLDTFPDEIALRDEILELKRQLMILKKTNEHNLVKFRKYEDEAKRKDRQIEQLMDPTKNTDIRKVLSTKGAAILMNLKDQNNALIQIIIDKDLQIKRLLGEIKTSKLYASSRNTEPYKLEISRLRNLLIKSQELLKEATEIPSKRSICIGGTPMLETSASSSDQSSPRELEELRFTIQSLETHMKYSNDLLGKKNQEIMILTEQLNLAKNAFQCKICNKKMSFAQKYDFDAESKEYDWLEATKLDFTSAGRKEGDSAMVTVVPQEVTQSDGGDISKINQMKSSSSDLLELFERTMTVTKDKKIKCKVPKSAPISTSSQILTKDSSPRRSSVPCSLDRSREIITYEFSREHDKVEGKIETDAKSLDSGKDDKASEELERLISSAIISNKKRLRSKSLFYNLTSCSSNGNDGCGSLVQERTNENGTERKKDKGKWKDAIKKVKKIQRRKRPDVSCYKKEYIERPMIIQKNTFIGNRKKKLKTSSNSKEKIRSSKQPNVDFSSNDSELETYEFEMIEKKIENDENEGLVNFSDKNEKVDDLNVHDDTSIKGKLTRQTSVNHSEGKAENQCSFEKEETKLNVVKGNEGLSQSSKVAVASVEDETFLQRRLSLQDPPKTKSLKDHSKAESVNENFCSSEKSDLILSDGLSSSLKQKSPEKKRTKVSEVQKKSTKNLQRSKDKEHTLVAPLPSRRVNIIASSSVEKVNEKEKFLIPSARRHSMPGELISTNNFEVNLPARNKVCSSNVEEIQVINNEDPKQSLAFESSLQEITTQEIEETENTTDIQQIKEEINNISSRFSPEIQRELKNLYDNITSYEEVEKKKVNSLREIYRQSIDSSFDSENSSTTRQEVKTVEVEVEINQIPSQCEIRQSQEDIETLFKGKQPGGEDFFNGEVDEDDDDVIFR